MIELYGDWIRIGGFSSKCGLVTNLWIRNVTAKTVYTPKGEYKSQPCDQWEVYAGVKNSGSHYWCATFETEAAATECLIEAARGLAFGEGR